MADKKISRKELLKTPDEFLTLSSRAVAYFQAHLRELKIAGVVAAVIVAGYLSVYGYLRYIDNKGQEAYNLAYETLTDTPARENRPQTVPIPDPAARQKANGLFEKVIQDYGMSKAARLALPQIAHIKFSEKEYDGAIRYYDRFASEISGHQEYVDLASMANASCYEAKGEFEKAISLLTAIVERKGNPFRETAMLNLERVYRLANKPDKAREILTQFVEEYKTSPFLPMAKARL